MTYTCEVCQTTFDGTAQQAFEAGWDTPEQFMSHCTCPNCPINKTVWWKLAVEHSQPTEADIRLLAGYNRIYDAAHPDTVAYLEHTDTQVSNTHRPDQCAGQWCTLHNRSNHPMRSFPQNWRADRGLMERVCEHGVGHPDPDELKLTGPELVHGCDGCCDGAYVPAGQVVEFWNLRDEDGNLIPVTRLDGVSSVEEGTSPDDYAKFDD